MSFFGKEYTLEREENFNGFLRAAGVSDEKIAAITAFKPTQKIVQNDDNTFTVTVTSPQETKQTTFTLGKEFEDSLRPGDVMNVTYSIDGTTVTQIVKSVKGIVTFKKEYKGDELVETITSNNWDGVAYRYYKA